MMILEPAVKTLNLWMMNYMEDLKLRKRKLLFMEFLKKGIIMGIYL